MADAVRPQPAADYNLLFGILALQMGFIQRDALVAAMNAWVQDKTQSLGQVLLQQKSLGAEEQALLEALVAKHLQRNGDDVHKSLATLSSMGSARDELDRIVDSDVQASLATLGTKADHDVQAGLATLATKADPSSTFTPSSAPSVSAPIHRYRIVRTHAKGGLGEVFLAHDQELKREVALKEIQDRHADHPESRARFLLEAEITGGLEHPGIVPVYGLGTYANGRPYYAMRFIQGDSLQEAIKRFHQADKPGRTIGERTLALRQLLRRFVDVCNALAYAHSRGVLHRDLKPGNIMLGKYGETLVVDWGLAKTLGQSEPNAAHGERKQVLSSGNRSSMTAMGAAVGTPAYMSPEQAAGRLDELGPASDVYSLGATLYCLLTGKPPVEGSDLDAVLRRVQCGDFPRPRQVKAAVPAALEAVCLKAMALAPADRYPTPKELADDLEHWLADEPVGAWHEPLTLRARRWMARHRTLVTAVAASGFVAITALTVGTVLLAAANEHERKARQGEAEARADAEGQRDRAVAAEKLAQTRLAEEEEQKRRADLEAQNTLAMLGFVQNKVLAAARPEGQEGGLGRDVTVRQALEAALPFVTPSFAQQPLTEARLRMTLGSSFFYLGDFKLAEQQHERAQELYAKYRGPDHPDTLQSMNDLALCYGGLGRHADARQGSGDFSTMWAGQNVGGCEETPAAQLVRKLAAGLWERDSC